MRRHHTWRPKRERRAVSAPDDRAAFARRVRAQSEAVVRYLHENGIALSVRDDEPLVRAAAAGHR
jgi:hypothetical protein